MKKIVKDAGAALSRVVQFTEEKIGTSEKTELDAHFENLWERAENTKNHTEKIVRDAEAVLIPNPGYRIEDFIYERIEKKRPSRLSNLEYLGLDMIEAGNTFGPGTAYGSALIKVGQWEQKLGQTERDFIGSAGMCFTQPLQKFLETEMKTIMKEKSILEMRRLDLDACKNRVRKARSMLGQNAERDLRVAQSEFDRQAEITKLLLEGISSSQAAHLRCLQEFVDTQARFYSQCTTVMTDLQRELSSLTVIPNSPNSFSDGSPSEQNDTKKAKVLYDYDAKDSTELTLKANEVLEVPPDISTLRATPGKLSSCSRTSAVSRQHASSTEDTRAYLSEAEVLVLDLETDGGVKRQLNFSKSRTNSDSTSTFPAERKIKEFVLLKKSEDLGPKSSAAQQESSSSSIEDLDNANKPRRRRHRKKVDNTCQQADDYDKLTDESDEECT